MKRVKSFYIVLMLGSLLWLNLSGCGNEKKTERPTMNMAYLKAADGTSYMVKNGSEQYLFQVAEGEAYDVQVSIKKTSGKISMYIAKDGKKENSIYEGNELPDSEFTVHVDESGEYVIWTEVSDFVGTYTYEPIKVR